jgi:ligand-binding sensor domain-containing protein
VTPSADAKGTHTVIASTLSDESGEYQFVNLIPGRYKIRCYTQQGYVYYREGAVQKVARGESLSNIDFRFARFKNGTWRTITTFDGLPDNRVTTIYQDASGLMWFGTFGGGLCRFDGHQFQTFTTENGLAGNKVSTIHGDSDGTMWIATHSGVSRYNGDRFENFTTQDGLAHNTVTAIHRHSDGTLWIGTYGGGVSRYDGGGEPGADLFVNFTEADGLGGNHVLDIVESADGAMWIASSLTDDTGLTRYDESGFRIFTEADGLSSNNYGNALYTDRDGTLWYAAGYPWLHRQKQDNQNDFGRHTENPVCREDKRIDYGRKWYGKRVSCTCGALWRCSPQRTIHPC